MLLLSSKSFPSLIKKLFNSIAIDVMKTPNPNFMKFMPVGHKVLGQQGTIDISSKQFSDISPLAQQLFKIEGVTRVFYASDYLSVAKTEDTDWEALKPQIFRIVSDHYQQNRPILVDNAQICNQKCIQNLMKQIRMIRRLFSLSNRQSQAESDLTFKKMEFNEKTGVLRLKLVGACAGCPSSAATLKGGIEKMLTYYIKQIKQVVAQQDCKT